MIMKLRSITFLLSIILLLGSCAKKKAQKKIEGSWLEVKVNNVDVPVGAQDMLTFGECKSGDCTLTISDASSTTTLSTFYELDDGGETLLIITLSGNFTIKDKNPITELTDTKIVIDWGTYIGEYTKI